MGSSSRRLQPCEVWIAAVNPLSVTDEDYEHTDVLHVTWTTGRTPLRRYFNAPNGDHFTTTSATTPSGYVYDNQLYYLEQTSAIGRKAVYSCLVRGGTDYFLSTDMLCEGQTTLGRAGYTYTSPPAGISSARLYRCFTTENFMTISSNCEGTGVSPSTQDFGYVALS